MATQLSADDARQSMNTHVATRGAEIRAKYGPQIGWEQLQQILQDRTCVRYPCEIVFDDAGLEAGELAHPQAKGERPEDGFIMSVRRVFQDNLDAAVAIILYQLVLVNYGAFASPDDAETFGASILGIASEEYYQCLCRMADQIEAT
jgi:hypothetical protein